MNNPPKTIVSYYACITPNVRTVFDLVLSTFTWTIPLRHKLELNVGAPYSVMSYD